MAFSFLLITFCYLLLLYSDYSRFSLGIPFITLLALDYCVLVVIMLLGAWYGVWLGLHWYGLVYEEKSHPGFVGHMVRKYWPTQEEDYNLRAKIVAAERKISQDVWELEDIAAKTEARPAVVKAPVVRKRVVRKSSKIK